MNEKAIIGCILGTAIGDSVGLPYEGLKAKRIAKLLKKPLRQKLIFGFGMISDDTEHTCCVAKALITAKGDAQKFERKMAWALRGWFLSLPAGMGLATGKACIKLCLGFPAKYSGVFSAGNGAAMRSALIGVVYANDLKRLKEFVYHNTRLTHSDPKAFFGALTIALAARQAVMTDETHPQDFLTLVEAQLKTEITPEYQNLLKQAIDSVASGENLHHFASHLGCEQGISGYVYHTVPCVIQCWLRHQNDYAAGLEEIIRAGGDTDTVGAIFGAIVGARVGKEGIPAHWLDKLCDYPRNLRYMEKLGTSLAKSQQGENDCKPPWLFSLILLPRNLLFLSIVLLHGFRRLLPPY